MNNFYHTFSYLSRPLSRGITTLLLLLVTLLATAQQSLIPTTSQTSTLWDASSGFSVTATGSGWSNLGNATDNVTSNSTDVSVSLWNNSNPLIIKDANNTYSAGNFVGFRFRFTRNPTANRNFVVTTYKNDATVESKTITVNYKNGDVQDIGFYTSADFDAISLTINGGSIGSSVAVLGAIQRNYETPLDCNVAEPLIASKFPVAVGPNTGSILLGAPVGPELSINDNLTDGTGLQVLLAGSAFLSIQNTAGTFPAGVFAGFDITNAAVLNIGLVDNITITTYVNGQQQESKTGVGSLINVGLLAGASSRVGFVTSKVFDEVQITIASVGLNLGSTVVHHATIQKLCEGPTLVCNTPTTLTAPTHPAIINNTRTGITGVLSVDAFVNNPANVVDNSSTNFATINLVAGVGTIASLSVKDELTKHSAGTYAGFDIDNANAVSLNVIDNMTITTYRNDTLQETISGSANLLGVGTSILSGTSRQTIGFITTKSFDEVVLSINSVATVSLGATRVYGLVLQTFCAGPALDCNVPVALQSQTPTGSHPLVINSKNTGIDALVCAGCSISNPQNLIDADTSTAATITLVAAVGANASISVMNVLDTYAANSFAGFNIGNPSILGVDLLNNIKITTYKDGVQKEVADASTGKLLAVPTLLLSGLPSRQTIGFITSEEFDEIKLTLTNTVNVEVGSFSVYGVFAQPFCDLTLNCNEAYSLTYPTFPVIVNSANTGVGGAICAGCAVDNVDAVLTPSIEDYATLSLPVAIAGTASISVKNNFDLPSGTFAGFTVRNPNSILQVDLLNSLTITTYKDGVEVEQKAGINLLNLSLLTPILGLGNDFYNIGFYTSAPFDEIQITAASLVGVTNYLHVYGSFVDTRLATGVDGGLVCLPELAPTLKLTPAIAETNTTVKGEVAVWNASPTNTASNGLITVRIPKNAIYTVDFDTQIVSGNVDNTIWNFDATSDATYYVFTTEASIASASRKTFQLSLTLAQPTANGHTEVLVNLAPNSGNDRVPTNNSDAERLDYFVN